MRHRRSLWLCVQPVVGPRHNPRAVILCRPHANAVQAGREIAGMEGNQVTIARVLGRGQDTGLEALVAYEGRVFAAALLGQLFSDIFLKALMAITSADIKFIVAC